MLPIAILPGRYALCQLPILEPLPNWVYQSSFYSISKTVDELSVVCEEDLVQGEIRKSIGWKLVKINAVLDLSLTGITAQFSTALAAVGVNLSVIVTFNTDYILIEETKLDVAIEALRIAGFSIDK